LSVLENQINIIANSSEKYYNYLPIVQSSGYGKTRSVCQLASKLPLIYVCFRKKNSSGYPPATLKSDIMLTEISSAANVDSATNIASQWLWSMIKTFHDMQLEGKSSDLLVNDVRLFFLFFLFC